MDNATESGSRVTRSLRKRLTSVDSESSSRPGTPISKKLTSISETSSPSKARRSTRRNSVSGVATPVKTPVKRGVFNTCIEESSELPMTARSTRRRSVSAYENDEACQIVLKVPITEVLHEEQTIITRSKSASPNNSFSRVATPVKTPEKPCVSRSVKTKILEPLMIAESTNKQSSLNGNNDDSLTNIKMPTAEVLDEKNLKQTIITRNNLKKSSSPKILESPTDDKNGETAVMNMKTLSSKKRKPGPKSKTRDHGDIYTSDVDTSDVEITVLEDDIKYEKNTSSNMEIIVLTEDDSTQMSSSKQDFEEHQEDCLKSTSVPNDSDEVPINKNELHNEQKIEILKDETILENSEKKNSDTRNDFLLEQKENLEPNLNDHNENNKNEILEKQDPTEITNETVEHNLEDRKTLSSSEVDNIYKDPKLWDNSKTPDVKKKLHAKENVCDVNETPFSSQVEEIENDRLLSNCRTPEKKKTPERVKILSVSNLTHDLKVVSKKVDFMSSPSNDFLVKSVYPKTPGTAKSKFRSHLKDDLSNLENQDIVTIEDNNIVTNKDDSFHTSEIIQTPTPINCEQDLKTVDDEKEVTSKNVPNELEKSYLKESELNESTNSKTENYSIKQNEEELKSFRSSAEGNTEEILKQDEDLTIANDSGDNADADTQLKIAFSSEVEELQDENDDKKEVISEKALSELETNPLKENLTIANDSGDNADADSQLKIVFSSEVEELQDANDDKKEVISEKALSELETNPLKENDKLDETSDEKSKNYNNRSPNENEEDLKWVYQSAKGNTVEGFKLDVVSANGNDSVDSSDSVDQKRKNERKMVFSSDDEDFLEDEIDCDEEEQSYKRRHDCFDDEAMEVEDYESGDSMDSEERREIEENEISVDGVSIGSQTTTDDGQVEDAEEEDSANSFIVSDIENLENSQSDYSGDEEANEEKVEKNKKTYTRIQRPTESSSSSDEDIKEQKLDSCLKSEGDIINNHNGKQEIMDENNRNNFKCQNKINESFTEQNSPNKSSDNTNLDSSKLSDSALRLHYTSYSKSDEEDNREEETNFTRKEILSNLNHSERFNKSVRELNLEVDESPVKKSETSTVRSKEIKNEERNITSSSSEDDINTESQLGEVSVTSESDADQENKNKSLVLPKDHKSGSGLSVSFGNLKKTKPKEKLEWQRSFTIGVTLKDGDLETALTDVKSKENEINFISSTDIQENEKIEDKGIEYVENLRHMPLPLGNPLIRTRRQSLALPTNPDMEICSSDVGTINKKIDRKSCGVLPDIDFKPSLSFIENIELEKNKKNQLSAKRKRLSKSFCGSTEAHDHSIIDIDSRHIHKRSKLMDESSVEESDVESAENTDSSKIFTKISSTPHERISQNDSYSKRILRRCDEILEAANHVKLEAKKRNKKNKTNPRKTKWKKKSSEESPPDDKILRSVPLVIKRKDKTKTALSQAIMTANAILSKTKTSTLQKEKLVEKPVKPNDIEIIRGNAPLKKKGEKEITQQKEKIKNVFPTSAGNFMEFPLTPEKKKIKYIKLPTGKVSVEPITPKKMLVQAFRESTVTPYKEAHKINSRGNDMFTSTTLRTGKRKRCLDESFDDSTRLNAQWTKSGLFKEEVISKRNNVSKKTKKTQAEGKQCNVFQNFKENALSRPEINRGTKRELLLLKERKRGSGTMI